MSLSLNTTLMSYHSHAQSAHNTNGGYHKKTLPSFLKS